MGKQIGQDAGMTHRQRIIAELKRRLAEYFLDCEIYRGEVQTEDDKAIWIFEQGEESVLQNDGMYHKKLEVAIILKDLIAFEAEAYDQGNTNIGQIHTAIELDQWSKFKENGGVNLAKSYSMINNELILADESILLTAVVYSFEYYDVHRGNIYDDEIIGGGLADATLLTEINEYERTPQQVDGWKSNFPWEKI